VKREDQARRIVGDTMEAIEHGVDVAQLADQIRGDDEIKLLTAPEVLGVADLKREARIFGSRDLDHPGAEIEAHSPRRIECVEQLAGTAAKLEHRAARRDDRLELSLDLGVIEGVSRVPLVSLWREPVVVFADLVLERIKGWPGESLDRQLAAPATAWTGPGTAGTPIAS